MAIADPLSRLCATMEETLQSNQQHCWFYLWQDCFLISAPYADKLPPKVAELIRKDVPFAVLLPLSLINEIERTGKTSIDESVREKRLTMKLIIATSLGQGWLINHPECKVVNSPHAVFFTTCSSNEQLHLKGTEAFHDWMQSTSSANIAPKTLNGEYDIVYPSAYCFVLLLQQQYSKFLKTYKKKSRMSC